MLLRELTAEDYPAALELYVELDRLHLEARPDLFVPRPAQEVFPRKAFEDLTADGEVLMAGAFDGAGTMLATVRATLWQDSMMVKGLKNVCLDNIYVLPQYRRRGIATALFRLVEQWSREQGAQRLDLHVMGFNAEAMAAYRAWGFGIQKCVMEKKLSWN